MRRVEPDAGQRDVGLCCQPRDDAVEDIVQGESFAEIARRRPLDLPALASIGGIGTKKLERYGAALLQAVTDE